jgi:hypothetical protein
MSTAAKMILLSHSGVDIDSDVHNLWITTSLLIGEWPAISRSTVAPGWDRIRHQFHPSLSISGEGCLIATIGISVRFPAFAPYDITILTILIIPCRIPQHHTRKMSCFR